ncbi:tyrosine-type recombinase/integrase [Paracidobacterium acidisoli]|uniref:Site-specific integrase n=1 Tax=Paracidobacterium acidisoli TaxID=2303751 RepID=A0A372IQC8_9BACT|nr:site-specific integrase [Paracidobacterium acidisoli]MBT9331478.1 site-specific integrase [Paracidobacterium acidisoli]
MAKKAKQQWDGIYQRKDRPGFWGSWKDAQGRRRTRKFNVYTLQQAQAALAAEKHKVEEAIRFGKPLPTEDSFAQFATEFLNYQERRISPVVVKGKISRTEYNRQAGIVERHLTPFFGDMKLAAIRRADVIRYIHSRMGEVGDGTVIKECNTLKRLFNVAIELDKIGANPAHKAPLPKAPEGRVRWLTNNELHKVFKECYIPPDGDGNEQEQWLQQAAGLALSLGARRGELLHTTLPDVNLDSRTVMLRQTKNGKARPAFINDLAMQVLMSMQVPERKKKRDRGPLFSGFTPEQLSMRFIRACRDAGIEDFSLHDLRHCYASHLRMAGADLHDLKELLGHSDLRMTIRYAHLSQAHLSAAAARLNGVLTLAPTVPPTDETPAPDSEK